MTVCAVLHAYAWPDRDALSSTLAALETVAPGRVLQVSDRADRPEGAAALVNRALAATSAELFIALEPAIRPSAADLARLVDSARGGLALANPRPLAPNDAPRCRLFAIPRTAFERLGGLDPNMWSIGYAEDLEARAQRSGLATSRIACDAEWIGPESYPIARPLARFLVTRNALRTAFRALPVPTLGPALAAAAAAAFLEAWRASALDASAFALGGTWRGGPRRGSSVWPRDEEGTIVPLLALDAFLDDLPQLLAERRQHRAALERLARTTAGAVPDLVGCLAGSGSEHLLSPRGNPSALPAHGDSPRDDGEESASPVVSVIVPNWNGRHYLEDCFSSLEASAYPRDRLELVLVDNGSTDDSIALVRLRFPRVKVVALERNRGFTGGNNAGVAAARGDLLVFLNNDMRVDRETIARLAAAVDARHPCAAARVSSWDGRRIDFVRGTVNWEARGYQEHYGKPARPEYTAAADTFFPNGGAFAITRAAYEEVGGFDDRYFAYYDDVDLGWRVRLAGYRIPVVQNALVYHRHGGTSGRYPTGQKRYLMERNALWTTIKNYEEGTLQRVLPAHLLLAARRVVQETVLDTAAPAARLLAPFSRRCRSRLARSRHSRPEGVYGDRTRTRTGERLIRRLPLETVAAVGSALEALPAVSVDRARVQAMRRAPDEEVLPQMGRGLQASSTFRTFQDAQDALVEGLELEPSFRGRTRVLIVTHEPLRPNISGPGVRSLELGRALAGNFAVTVAAPYPPEIREEACTLAPYSYQDPSTLLRLAEEADVLVVRGFTLEQFPFLAQLDVPIVVDLYCPFTLEHLEMTRSRPRGPGGDRVLENEAATILAVQNAQLREGDFFLCASERQRDFWLGALHTAGRINPRTYADDPSLRRLIDVVPFGLPDAAPQAAQESGGGALKGLWPGIGPTDRVLLWGGSILDWQDPQTLVRAVARLGAERDDVKLFFMGTRHPNPDVVPMRALDECLTLARELGVLDRHVFFNDWVPYAERARYLLDADAGLSTHRNHLETRYSFRTRILDYIWAGLPIVCTTGDHFSELVERRGLGLTVPPGDERALAVAITRVLDDEVLREGCRERLREVAGTLRWSVIVEPLRGFCARPRFAADRARRVGALRAQLSQSYRVSKWVKRTLLRAGMSEAHFERVKHWPIVQTAITARNRIVRMRAEQAVGRHT